MKVDEYKVKVLNAKDRAFFNELSDALCEAIEIERKTIPVESVPNMKYTTYRATEEYFDRKGYEHE